MVPPVPLVPDTFTNVKMCRWPKVLLVATLTVPPVSTLCNAEADTDTVCVCPPLVLVSPLSPPDGGLEKSESGIVKVWKCIGAPPDAAWLEL